MTAAVMPSSAAGLLTLLADDNDELKHYALVHLNKVVHEFWFQIASYIGSVEALYEDDEFKDRELAALIASKVWGELCPLLLPSGSSALEAAAWVIFTSTPFGFHSLSAGMQCRIPLLKMMCRAGVLPPGGA